MELHPGIPVCSWNGQWVLWSDNHAMAELRSGHGWLLQGVRMSVVLGLRDKSTICHGCLSGRITRYIPPFLGHDGGHEESMYKSI